MKTVIIDGVEYELLKKTECTLICRPIPYDTALYVPDNIEFEYICGKLGLKFDVDRSLYYLDGLRVDHFLDEYKIKCKLVETTFDELEIGDWFCRCESYEFKIDYSLKTGKDEAMLIGNDKEILFVSSPYTGEVLKVEKEVSL